jgi:hypothetical protein
MVNSGGSFHFMIETVYLMPSGYTSADGVQVACMPYRPCTYQFHKLFWLAFFRNFVIFRLTCTKTTRIPAQKPFKSMTFNMYNVKVTIQRSMKKLLSSRMRVLSNDDKPV